MANTFLQNDVLIYTYNLPVLFLIGNFTHSLWYTLSEDDFSLYSVSWRLTVLKLHEKSFWTLVRVRSMEGKSWNVYLLY